MNAHEAFAERTKKIEALAYRLDHLAGLRESLIRDLNDVRELVERRHHEGLSAASLLSDLFTYHEQLKTKEHELADLLQSIEEFFAADQAGG